MRRIEKIIHHSGILLIFAAIVLNPMFLGYLFAPDQRISSLPLLVHIVLWEVILFCAGLFFLYKYSWIMLHLKQLLLCFFTLVLFLIIFEILLRFAEHPIIFPVDTKYHYTYVPNTKIVHTIPEGKTFTKQTNSKGFVDDEFVGEKPVFLLGDSFAACLQAEDCVHTLLEKELRVSVFNFGVGGYGTLHELGILQEYAYLKPSLVLLYFLPQNDLLENERYLYAEKSWLNTGNEKRGIRIFAFYREKMEMILQKIMRLFPTLRPQLTAEKSVQNYEVYLQQYPSAWETRWQTECDALGAFADVTASLHATLVLITVTGSEQVYPSVWKELQEIYPVLHEKEYNLSKPNALIAACAEELSIFHLDLLPLFQQDQRLLHYPVDGHWNAEGQRFAAEKIRGFLEEKNIENFE